MKIIMAANGFEDIFQTWLKGMGFKYSILNGVYKGVSETSFCIEVKPNDMPVLYSMAALYRQESVLIITDKVHAWLYFIVDKTLQKLGEWRRVDRDIAIKNEAYSHDPATDKYYLAA